MLFNQLNIGDKVYIIEVVGTFKKTTEYSVMERLRNLLYLRINQL